MTLSSERNLKGTVLVVEDDDDVRDVAANMLREEGFTVISVGDAISALREFENHIEIDLVFSDLVLPGGVSGIDMAKTILKIDPNSRILMTTGHREKEVALKNKAGEFDNISFEPKPYDVNKLPKIIDNLIKKTTLEG